jgi:hypothetical protein
MEWNAVRAGWWFLEEKRRRVSVGEDESVWMMKSSRKGEGKGANKIGTEILREVCG